MWENICDIIQGAGTTERENYWAPYMTSFTQINSVIDFNSYSQLTQNSESYLKHTKRSKVKEWEKYATRTLTK